MIESFVVDVVASQGHSLFKLAIPLMSILKLDPQLADLHEREYIRDPLDHEGGQLLLVREGLADLQKGLQLVSLDPSLSRHHCVLIVSHSGQGELITSIFVFHKGTSDLQSQVGCVEDLLDVQDVDDGPSVLCEGAKRQSILPDKCSC